MNCILIFNYNFKLLLFLFRSKSKTSKHVVELCRIDAYSITIRDCFRYIWLVLFILAIELNYVSKSSP